MVSLTAICSGLIATLIWVNLAGGINTKKPDKPLNALPNNKRKAVTPSCMTKSSNMDEYWTCITGDTTNISKKVPLAIPVKKSGRRRRKREARALGKPRITDFSFLPYIAYNLQPYVQVYYDQFYAPHRYEFRPQYDKDNLDQDGPPWLYHGLTKPENWHKMPHKKFHIPIKHGWELKDLIDKDIGKLVEQSRIDKTENGLPHDRDWTPNKGYFTFYRYPWPLPDRGVRDEIEEAKIYRDNYQLSLTYPICQHNEQSPLDIKTDRAIQSSLTEYYLTGVDVLRRLRIELPEDGTSLLTCLVDNSGKHEQPIALRGGALKGETFYLDRIWIHYGQVHGSEHRINGKAYNMELQFVFSRFNPDSVINNYYRSLARITNSWFSYREKIIVILAVFVRVTNHPKDPQLFEALAQAANKYIEQRDEQEQSRSFHSKHAIFRMRGFIPTHGRHYTYRGSLTHPPCFSHIIWSVFEDPLDISTEQFSKFLHIPAKGTEDTDYLTDNFRPLESIYSPLEDLSKHPRRVVEANKQIRLNRVVLRSIIESENNHTIEENYDYDREGNSCVKYNANFYYIILVTLVHLPFVLG